MNVAEETLYSYLTDVDSLDCLVREGFSSPANRECIPSKLGRDIVGWVLDLYHKSGRQVAPTRAGIEETWARAMEDEGLVVDDTYEGDSLQWAIEQLRSAYVHHQISEYVIRLANGVNKAAPPDRVEVVKNFAGELYGLSAQLSSHRQEVPVDLGVEDAWVRYQGRVNAQQHVEGLTFGLDPIDRHIMGVRPGEMALFLAYAGSGKSWLSVKSAYAEWRRGRQTVLFTLENDVDMTIDRLCCLTSGMSYEHWQRGTVDEGSLRRFHDVRERFKITAHSPIVIKPAREDRDPVALVRRAYALGAESIIVDQLSHVEPMPGYRPRERRDIVTDQLQGFYDLINGQEPIPALIIAQTKREGWKRAVKEGRYELDAGAESAELERTPNFVFSALRTDLGTRWQTLKARRVKPKDWMLAWRLGYGDIRVLHEIREEETAGA